MTAAHDGSNDRRAAARRVLGPGWPEMGGRRHLEGTAEIRRVGEWSYPVYELIQGNHVLATMGRAGWFSIFLGRGQQVDFPDGVEWRVKSVGMAAHICPVVIDEKGRRVALALLGAGNYGINGKDFGCTLNPEESRRRGRANRWTLNHFEDELGVVTRKPWAIHAEHPIPMGVVLLSFVLVRFGIVGESAPRLPQFRWGVR